jgi:hypothetical protein
MSHIFFRSTFRAIDGSSEEPPQHSRLKIRAPSREYRNQRTGGISNSPSGEPALERHDRPPVVIDYRTALK